MSEPYKNEKGLWDVNFRYVDYKGDHKRKHKCNFKTKREAQEFMDSFLAKQSKNLNMSFKDFVDLYYEDMSHRLRENTMRSKKYIIDLKLIPYFGKRNICEISAADIRLWQNELLEQNYAQTYLKTINNQLTAIFNYAVRYYDLPRKGRWHIRCKTYSLARSQAFSRLYADQSVGCAAVIGGTKAWA